MKKVLIIVISVLIALPLITAGAGYGYIRYYYRDTYMPGLSVNNVYAADLTVEQLNNKLKEGMEIPEVTVTDKDGEIYTFSMTEADYDENYTEDLKQIRESQTVEAFLRHLFDENAKIQKRDVFPVITYDESKLDTFLDDQKYLKDDSKMAGKRIEIRESKTEGYFLYDETKSMLNHDKAKAVIEDAVSDGNYEVKLKENECYEKPSNLTPAQKYALRTWNKIRPYMETEITFDFGGVKEVIDGAQIAQWLVRDEQSGLFEMNEDDTLFVDEEAVNEYMTALCDKYSTVNKPRTIKATRGDLVTIEKGTYGSKVDTKTELEFLRGQLGSGRKVERKVKYSQTPFSGKNGFDDIGNTYIEVDMTNQHLYYYKNGTLKLDSDVVTGNTSLGRGTPERVCYVYFKQRNRTLRGPDYASFVSYWIAVYNNIGIHDASWRGKYGGQIYRSAGSHGCVNTPKAKVSELYDMVEIGTPVLLFY